jgi:hypothetical protein
MTIRKTSAKRASPLRKASAKRASPRRKASTKRASPRRKASAKRASPRRKTSAKRASPRRKASAKRASPRRKASAKRASPRRANTRKRSVTKKLRSQVGGQDPSDPLEQITTNDNVWQQVTQLYPLFDLNNYLHGFARNNYSPIHMGYILSVLDAIQKRLVVINKKTKIEGLTKLSELNANYLKNTDSSMKQLSDSYFMFTALPEPVRFFRDLIHDLATDKSFQQALDMTKSKFLATEPSVRFTDQKGDAKKMQDAIQTKEYDDILTAARALVLKRNELVKSVKIIHTQFIKEFNQVVQDYKLECIFDETC